MYPNPQDVLPLPPRPSLEQYKKRAKDLVKACKSGDSSAIRNWAVQWIEAIATLRNATDRPPRQEQIEQRAAQIAQFASAKLLSGDNKHAQCVLADAQFIIARAHGFTSWATFATHLEGLARTGSATSTFESAADAIVIGDIAKLDRLLRENPELIRERSTREHRAALLHYVAANGVENYRQETPKNAVDIAELLLERGAEVDAEADVYGGGARTLGLAATSVHPFKAGVQNELIDVLLKHGARLDRGIVHACLANGRPEAAEYLVARGATLDLDEAAGVGRLDVVKRFFNDDGSLKAPATHAQMQSGFSGACAYGHAEVVDFLLERGMDVDVRLNAHGRGHTALHVAAFHARVDIVKALLRLGAPVDVTDATWGTTPLIWALHAWSHEPTAPPEQYHAVVAALVAAGSVVKPEWLQWDAVRADAKMLAVLGSK